MKKEIKKVEIFSDCKRASNYSINPYKWGEIKELLAKENIVLEDNDVLKCGFEEAYNDGDSARDAMYVVSVEREREETDEEFERREKHVNSLKEESKKKRYDNYLKLKEEFEK